MLAHILKAYDIKNIVISPGSRNAPLAIQFGEMDEYHSYSIVDERSAAFVALGMAKAEKHPVAITCTSGSAVANYYPAITEAFYQNVPLLLLTADRPTDYTDIFDGQTIRQNHLFQQHSYGDFQLMENDGYEAEEYNWQTIKNAVELCIEKQGPVHINIPLAEPLYELTYELPVFPKIESTVRKSQYVLPSHLIATWHLSKRIMILVGTQDYNKDLESQLAQLVKNHSVVILKEANSNLTNNKFFGYIDRYIFGFTEEDFKTYAPDLLITVGQNVVSKKIKEFLRKVQPKEHWHVDPFWHPDTYFCLTESIKASPEQFFNQILGHVNLEPRPFYNLWNILREKKDKLHQNYLNRVGFSDFCIHRFIAEKTPDHYSIHFSNSSAIRYAQLFDFGHKKIYCNRGTSGIEGSTSTAMGFAIKSKNPTLLVSGDLSFLYDINGLWNDYIPPYTRIIVINNGEGNIFKFIPGPTKANRNIVDEFIATKHQKTAEHVAKHFGLEYIKVEDELTAERVLNNFFNPSPKPRLMEVFTHQSDNASILKNYFKYLSEGFEG